MTGLGYHPAMMNSEMHDYHLSGFERLLRALKVGFLAFCIFLVFTVLVEALQAYQILHNVHPFLGWLFAVVVLILIGGAVCYYLLAMSRMPAVLIPPPTRDPRTMTKRQARSYARYLADVLDRLSRNLLIAEDQRSALKEHAVDLRAGVRNSKDVDDLIPAIVDKIERVIMPAVKPLDEEAGRRVQRCVRDTMLGVTVSPWRSIDLFVVLYRNGQMIVEVSRVYNGRPRLREQVSIFADVIRVAATVQFLNIGSKLLENLTSWIPVLGRFTDDIAQGIGAGLFTSVAGHATIDRCRAFQGWNEEEAKNSVGPKLRMFMADLKGIVADVIMPALKGRIEAGTPEDRRAPNMIEKAKSGIGEAIDVTCETIGTCVRKPVSAGYRGVTATGTHLWETIVWAGKQGAEMSVKGLEVAGKGAAVAGPCVVRTGKSVFHGAVRCAKGVGHVAMSTVKAASHIVRRKPRD